MAQQLRRGADQLLSDLYTDLDSIEDMALDNPQAVRTLARRMRKRMREDLYKMLLRADGAQPSIEERFEALEQQIAELKARIE